MSCDFCFYLLLLLGERCGCHDLQMELREFWGVDSFLPPQVPLSNFYNLSHFVSFILCVCLFIVMLRPESYSSSNHAYPKQWWSLSHSHPKIPRSKRHSELGCSFLTTSETWQEGILPGVAWKFLSHSTPCPQLYPHSTDRLACSPRILV